MPLRPDFNHWYSIISEDIYRGHLRKRFAIRSNDFFGASSDQWLAVMRRAKEKLSGKEQSEITVILECLRLLGNDLDSIQYISEIIFTRGEKPFYVLDNVRVLYPTDKSIVVHIDLDKMIRFGYVSDIDLKKEEDKRYERQRWTMIYTGALFGMICSRLENLKL